MRPQLKQDKDMLFGLSLDEKRAIYDQIALELSGTPEPFGRLETETWDAIVSVCPDARPNSMSRQVASYGRKRYSDKCKEIDEFLEDACEPMMRLPIRSRVRTAVLRCLANWMKDTGILVSVPTLLNSVGYLPGAVDDAFPGYAGCKLLHKVAPAYA